MPPAGERSVPSKPSVSVIVGAYRRGDYVLGAVRSVAEQTLPSSEYEIIVLTDEARPALLRELEPYRVRLRVDPQQHIGRWLAGAIDETRAEIVTFLDDDDEYDPERLGRVVDTFARHPGLSFLHHRTSVIDRDGRPVPSTKWRAHELALDHPTGEPYVPPEEKQRRLGEILAADAGFNLSSMALRRADLVGPLGRLLAGSRYVPDLPLLLIGLLAPGGLFLEERRLTRYRHHGANRTMDSGWIRDAADDRRRLSGEVRALGGAFYADWIDRLADHFDKLASIEGISEAVRAGASREEVAQKAGGYLRLLGRAPAERTAEVVTWAIVAYAAGYLVAPAPTRRLLGSRESGRAELRRGMGFA